MKINHDYPVVSSRHNNADPRIDYLLFGAVDGIDEDEMKFLGERNSQFPANWQVRTISFRIRVICRLMQIISANS